MLPLSTSSSDRRSRRWRAWALVAGGALIGVEALLHLPEVRSALPPRTHYYHPAIARRIDALDRVMQVHGRVDVLFVGSSIVLTNVHPVVFDALASLPPGRVVSFNAALAGLWPTSVHLYTEHLWLPAARPRVVVQGVRYAELAATTHAKHETQVWGGRIEPSWRDSGIWTRLKAAAVSRIMLLQYQGAMTQYLQRFKGGWTGAEEADADAAYAARGYQPAPNSSSRAEEWRADLPNDGTCTGQRCAVGFAALRRSVEAARRNRAGYVLVNVPEHPSRWHGAGGPERYRHYVESLAAFAASEGVAFVDPTDGNPFRFASTPYTDFSHMTAAGARQFTRELAMRMAPIVASNLRPRELRARGETVLIPAGASGRRGPG